MPKPRAGKLENATARRRLEVRRKPYYATISPAIQLGYRRNIGSGSWSVRCIGQGADWIKKIALADDLEPADGKHVLTYWQAIDVARALARRQPGADDANPRSRSAKRLTATSAISKAAAPMRRTQIGCAGI